MNRAARVLACVALAIVGTASPALAARPIVEEFVETGAFDIDCGAFVLHETFTETVRVTTFLDAAGEPDRLIANVRFLGLITTSDGSVLRDNGFFNDFVDLAGPEEGDETVREAGFIFNIVIPGMGSVAQDTGLIIFQADGDVIVRGPHEVFDAGSVESLLCPLF